MVSKVDELTVDQRYSRAVRLTAPKIASGLAGVPTRSYWLDEHSLFFLQETLLPHLGHPILIPAIADCRSSRVEEVIPVDRIASLLAELADEPIDQESFSCCEFDMPDSDTLGVSFRGQDYLIDRRQQRIVLVRASSPVAALYSPDRQYACFLKDFDLWLRDCHTGTERAVTTDGARHFMYGQPSQIGLSAVSHREWPSPLGLWSADSQWFLTHRIDERSLPELALVQHAPPGGGRPILHRYKYSMPGDPLPVATYVAIHIPSGRLTLFDEFPTPVTTFSPFQFRMAWFDRGDTAWFVRFDRYFRQAELIRLDLAQGMGRIVLTETTLSGYLELQSGILATPNVRTLAGSDEVIWFSQRDGWGHLYLYDAVTGILKNRITEGEWVVRDIVQVDERRRRVFFLAGGVDPTMDPASRCLCSVGLDGNDFAVLLQHDGDIDVPKTEACGLVQDRPFQPSYAQPGFSPDAAFAVVCYSSVDKGNRTEIADLRTRRSFLLASAIPGADDVRSYRFGAMAADGVTQLHGVMYCPSYFDARRKYPLIDHIYPGPSLAHQPQSFRSINAAQAMALAEVGFVTIMLDTRGMPIGSRAFRQAGYGALLEPQLADHAAVVRQLCDRHSFIDRKRVGMLGWSGGGAATVRALCDYGDIFTVGVAVCGNHDSNVYTALWSDKYRGPGNPAIWVGQANTAVAHKLQGRLLLISGDMDENVHLSHTLSLVDALIRANRNVDMLIVPNEGHLLLMKNGYAQRRTWDYFVSHLLGETPPADFAIKYEPRELNSWTQCVIREARK